MDFKPKKQTPENTVTHNYTKKDLEKQKSFVMCPTPGCTAELTGSWNNYKVWEKNKFGKKVPKKNNGLQVYKCPSCNSEFTVNNFSVNSIPIPDFDGIGVIIQHNEIKFRVNGFERFKDSDGDTYVYLPLKYITEDSKFFYIPTDNPEISDDELKEMLKDYKKSMEKS